jgi:hypothetical protein
VGPLFFVNVEFTVEIAHLLRVEKISAMKMYIEPWWANQKPSG